MMHTFFTLVTKENESICIEAHPIDGTIVLRAGTSCDRVILSELEAAISSVVLNALEASIFARQFRNARDLLDIDQEDFGDDPPQSLEDLREDTSWLD